MATWQHSDNQTNDTRQWVESHEWLGLQCRKDGTSHQEGSVEFIAYYRPKGSQKRLARHELSDFAKINSKWLYAEGQIPRSIPKKTGPNDPCPCSSGKEFKHC